MSCLLKQWLVIKCTKDALHLRQCTGMYVYKIYIDYLIILINNMQIVTFLFCISLPFKKVIGRGDWWGAYLNGAWPKGWVFTWGRVLT